MEVSERALDADIHHHEVSQEQVGRNQSNCGSCRRTFYSEGWDQQNIEQNVKARGDDCTKQRILLVSGHLQK